MNESLQTKSNVNRKLREGSPGISLISSATVAARPRMPEVRNARDVEAEMIDGCVRAALGRPLPFTVDQRRASVMCAAASLLRSQSPREAQHLQTAGDQYFATSQEPKVPLDEMIRRRWVADAPRFRNMLDRGIAAARTNA